MESTKAVHHQHVICLINTWVKTWLLIACETAFYAIIANYQFYLFKVNLKKTERMTKTCKVTQHAQS